MEVNTSEMASNLVGGFSQILPWWIPYIVGVCGLVVGSSLIKSNDSSFAIAGYSVLVMSMFGLVTAPFLGYMP